MPFAHHPRHTSVRLLLFVSAFIGIAAAAALPGRGRSESPLSLPPAAPAAQGSHADWVPNTGSELAAIAQTTCGAGDGTWITGANGWKSTYLLDLSTVPPGGQVVGVDVTICYGDDNATIDGFERIVPILKWGSFEYAGTGLSSPGITPTTSTQSFNDVAGEVEIGIQDKGFLAQSRLRVYGIWAVIRYLPPPPPLSASVTVSDTVPHGVIDAKEAVTWHAQVQFSPNPPLVPVLIRLGFDPAVLTLYWGSPEGGGALCQVQSPGVATCNTAVSSLWNFTFLVNSSPGQCETTLHVGALDGGGTLLDGAEDTAPINGGCATPTSPATALPTSATTVPAGATTTVPSVQPSNTPGGAPTSTPTMIPTATPATPTMPAGVTKFRLRLMWLARDGT